MNELIRIDFEKGVLKTPDHEYHIATTLSVDRYMQFELLQCGAAYGVTFADMHDTWLKIEDALNKVKFVEAAAIIANMKEALIKGNDKKKHLVMQICALFLNEKDEDVRVWKQEVMDAKVQDWLDSGVCYEDFFRLTVNVVPRLLTVLQETSQAISSLETETEKKVEAVKTILETSKAMSKSSGQ